MTEFEEFQAVVARSYKQREKDSLEEWAAMVERLNAKLAGLPPEGEWTS